VEFLAAGGIDDLDQEADLVGAVAADRNYWMLKSGVVFTCSGEAKGKT
jgi:hypothetical protein